MLNNRSTCARRPSIAAIAMAALLFAACGRPSVTSGVASGERSPSPTGIATSPSSSPSPCATFTARAESGLAYDSDRQNMVLFGGAGKQIYGDTWLWSGSCWKPANPTGAPSPRYETAAAFDPNTHVVVVYGGRTETDAWLDDTWTWDGGTWTQVQQTPHPVMRFAIGAFDPAIGKVVVYGLSSDYSTAETWTWNGSWQQIATSVAPPPRFSSALGYDASSGAVILFGGRQTLGYLADTWAFDGVSWKQLSPSISPPARQNHQMTSVSQGLLLVAGDGPGTTFADTWLWNTNGWQVLATVHSPTGWGAAGMTSRNGQALRVSFGSIDGPAQTYSFVQGDWISQ